MSLSPSERYTFPAWGFLLGVLAVNLDKILELRNNPEVLLLIAFLGIFGGFPLGFFVSQFYYAVMLNFLGGHSKVWTKCWGLFPKDEKSIGYLVSKGIKKDKAFYVCEFILIRFSKSNEGEYIRRRWFVFHTDRSLSLSIAIGTIFGLAFRVLFLNASFWTMVPLFCFPYFFYILIWGLVVFCLFPAIASLSTKKTEEEIDEYRYLSLQEILREHKLEDIIPEEYFENKPKKGVVSYSI
jgi:hypothetical protein